MLYGCCSSQQAEEKAYKKLVVPYKVFTGTKKVKFLKEVYLLQAHEA
jgi:hypothetical protein